jgi:hypothetical protein
MFSATATSERASLGAMDRVFLIFIKYAQIAEQQGKSLESDLK